MDLDELIEDWSLPADTRRQAAAARPALDDHLGGKAALGELTGRYGDLDIVRDGDGKTGAVP